MKSLASVTFSFLLLASVSFFPVYAQDAAATQKPAAATENKPVAATPDPAKDGAPADDDASIEDILAGVDDEENSKESAHEAGKTDVKPEVKAEAKPEEAKKVDNEASKETVVEKDVKVEEPSGEALQTEKQAVEEEKQAEEQKKQDEAKVEQAKKEEKPVEKVEEKKVAADAGDVKSEEDKTAADEKKTGEVAEAADGEELKLFENPEKMELGDKMPVETKELELPGDAASQTVTGGTGCIRPAGEIDEMTVPEVCDYVDIHTRRIAYRTKARILRESLEKRRVSFEEPHFEALEKHRADIARIDAEDSAAYQKDQGQKGLAKNKGGSKSPGMTAAVGNEADVPEGYSDIDELSPEELQEKFGRGAKPKFFNPREAMKKAKEKEKEKAAQSEKKYDGKVTAEDASAVKKAEDEPKVALKEKEMPPEHDEAGNTVKNKKVVVPEDAPEFDPSLIQ